MLKDYKGSKYNVIHCDGAIDSLNKAMERVPAHEKRTRKAQMLRLIERLGDGMNMPRDSFPDEGVLPDGSNFKAFKKLPLRAYLWLSKRYQNTYFISHYIYKDYQKLKKSDIEKVKANWRKKEE